MTSNLWNVNLQDVVRGLGNAITGAFVFAALQVLSGVFGAPDFNLFNVDWAGTGMAALNAGITAAYTVFVSYLAGKFAQDKDGKFLGRWGK